MGLKDKWRAWRESREKIYCANCGNPLGTKARPKYHKAVYGKMFCTYYCALVWSKDPKNKDAVIRYYLGDIVSRSHGMQE